MSLFAQEAGEPGVPGGVSRGSSRPRPLLATLPPVRPDRTGHILQAHHLRHQRLLPRRPRSPLRSQSCWLPNVSLRPRNPI